jgi:hypothetical protein
MSESQEQQKEPVAPKKAKKGDRREADAAAAVEPAKAAEVAPIEIKIASDEVAASAPARQRALPYYSALAAALLVALGIGWAAGHATTAISRPAANPAHGAIMAIDWAGLASDLQKGQRDTMRMAADVQALKGALVELKESAGRSKQEIAGRFGQLADRLDRIQNVDQEIAAKLAGMTERFDKAERESGARLASLVERFEKTERPANAQAAPAPKALLQAALQPPASTAPPAPPVDPDLRTGSIPDQNVEGGKSEPPKTDAKAMPIEGWVLREVYDGVALIEGRNKRLLEIAPGQSLSGIGRVESIERRGRSWVVITTRGVITSQPW